MTYYTFRQLAVMKGLKFVNMNVQNLCDKISRIRKLDLDFDYINVTETWLKGDDLDYTVSLPGMTMYRKDRTDCLRKGAV